MAKNLSLLFFCLITIGVSAQEITILSKQDEFPIEGITVLTKEGNLAGITDFDGVFKLDSIHTKENYFILNHYEIENDTMYLNKVVNNEYFVKTKNIVNLDEAVITSDKDFAILEGYFTTFVTNNGKFNIFADGIMQIAVNRKSKRVKKGKILEYRTFILEHKDDDENRKKVSSIVFDDFIELPNLKLIRKFKRDNNQSKIKSKTKGELTNFELRDDQDMDFHIRLFGYDFSGFAEILNINTKHSDLSKLNKIKHFSYFFTMDIKHKKEPEYSTIQNTTNFYTLRVLYKDRKDIDENYIKFDFEKSHYETEFWNDEKTASLYKLFSNIFKSDMIEQPNNYK